MDIFDSVKGFLGIAAGVVGLVVLGYIVYRVVKSRYKAADANQVLVISGSKKGLKTHVAGGAFVSPFHKVQYFSLETMTVQSDDQETQSETIVPVIVKWTAQLRADTETPGALDKAIQGFISYKDDAAIAHSLKQTLDGEVRAVIATMTPEAVVREKEHFSAQVTTGVQERMTELGFKLVSLNIAEVSDNNNHYYNLAAGDREAKRLTAETLKANADKDIAVSKAATDQISKTAQLESDLQIAEKQRGVDIRTSEIRAETDVAAANAEIAGELQRELRNQELATRKGEVKVIEAHQDQATALAQREAELTRAQTEAQRRTIEAEADAQKAQIEAGAEAKRSEIAAEAAAKVARQEATGEAEAAKERARGEAEAIQLTTQAKTEQVRQTGLAEAEVARAKGEAEAAATLAKGEAEAEVQRKMAEALAANNGVKLQVTLAEIERDTRIKVSSALGEVMAHIGENATFIDMGGSGSSDSDLLSSVLGRVPELLKRLDVKSGALQGMPFGESMGALISSVSGGGTNNAAPVTVIESTTDAQEDTTNPVESAEGSQEPSNSELTETGIAANNGVRVGDEH